MKTHADVIDKWPSLREFADDIGVPYVTAQVMKHRDSIASRHWTRVVDAAQRRGIKGITERVLAQMASAKDGDPPPGKPRPKPRTEAAA